MFKNLIGDMKFHDNVRRIVYELDYAWDETSTVGDHRGSGTWSTRQWATVVGKLLPIHEDDGGIGYFFEASILYNAIKFAVCGVRGDWDVLTAQWEWDMFRGALQILRRDGDISFDRSHRCWKSFIYGYMLTMEQVKREVAEREKKEGK